MRTGLLALFLLASFGARAHADPVLDFVREVMSTEMAYGKQFMDSDRVTLPATKARWTDEAAANAERMKNISRKFLLDQDIDPAMPIDAYQIDSYEILGRSGPFVFVRRRLDGCSKKKGCVDDTVLTLNVAMENGGMRIVPGGVSSLESRTSVNFWWTRSYERHVPLCDALLAAKP